MTDDLDEGSVWQLSYTKACWEFGQRCRAFHDGNPNGDNAGLDHIMSVLATELWDQGFSQTEIRTAFEGAIAALVPYAGGEERRGARY